MAWAVAFPAGRAFRRSSTAFSSSACMSCLNRRRYGGAGRDAAGPAAAPPPRGTSVGSAAVDTLGRGRAFFDAHSEASPGPDRARSRPAPAPAPPGISIHRSAPRVSRGRQHVLHARGAITSRRRPLRGQMSRPVQSHVAKGSDEDGRPARPGSSSAAASPARHLRRHVQRALLRVAGWLSRRISPAVGSPRPAPRGAARPAQGEAEGTTGAHQDRVAQLRAASPVRMSVLDGTG